MDAMERTHTRQVRGRERLQLPVARLPISGVRGLSTVASHPGKGSKRRPFPAPAADMANQERLLPC